MGRFALVSSVGRNIDHLERVPRPPLRGPMYGRRPVREPIESSLSGIGAAAIAAALGAGPGGSPAGLGAAPLEDLTPEQLLAPEEDLPTPFIQSTLSEVEDNRFFNPDETRSLRRISTKPVRRMVVSGSRIMPLGYAKAIPWGISPKAKASVIMCIRRHARRGVILALGQGGGYHRPPRRSPTSDIWC